MMKRVIKWGGIGIIVVFIAMQVIRPAKTNPAIDESRAVQAHTNMTPEVSAILDRACYDCHSNRTVWPWYSQIAPVSWWLTQHVNQGRKELSFSDWARMDAKRTGRKLQQICEQVEKGEMPISSYLILHPEARLSDSDKQTLCDWAKRERERITGGAPQSDNKQ